LVDHAIRTGLTVRRSSTAAAPPSGRHVFNPESVHEHGSRANFQKLTKTPALAWLAIVRADVSTIARSKKRSHQQ